MGLTIVWRGRPAWAGPSLDRESGGTESLVRIPLRQQQQRGAADTPARRGRSGAALMPIGKEHGPGTTFRPADTSPAGTELDRRSRQQADVMRASASWRSRRFPSPICSARRCGRSARIWAGPSRSESGWRGVRQARRGGRLYFRYRRPPDRPRLAGGAPAREGGPIVRSRSLRDAASRARSFSTAWARRADRRPSTHGRGNPRGLAAGDAPDGATTPWRRRLPSVGRHVLSAAVLRSRQDDELRRSQNRWRPLARPRTKACGHRPGRPRRLPQRAHGGPSPGSPGRGAGKEVPAFSSRKRSVAIRGGAMAPDPELRDTIEVEVQPRRRPGLRVLMSRRRWWTPEATTWAASESSPTFTARQRGRRIRSQPASGTSVR